MLTLTRDEITTLLNVLGPMEPEPCEESLTPHPFLRHAPPDHHGAAHAECSGYTPSEVDAIYAIETRLRAALEG